MKRIFFAILATLTALVGLFAYHTSTNRGAATGEAEPALGAGAGTGAGAAQGGAGATVAPTSTAQAPGSGSSSQAGAGSSSAHGASGLKNGSFTGSTVPTPFGQTQVQITVSGGKIASAQAVQYADGDRESQRINESAIPQLSQEAIAAQSASISMISGATYTSQSYVQSLQAAIDSAKA